MMKIWRFFFHCCFTRLQLCLDLSCYDGGSCVKITSMGLMFVLKNDLTDLTLHFVFRFGASI